MHARDVRHYSTMNAIVEKRTNEYKMGPLASCVARSVSSITASTFVEHRLPLMKKKRPLYRQSPYFKLTAKDETVCLYSPSPYLLSNGFKTGVFHTNPGDNVTGQLAFEVPQSAKATKLSYGDLINGVATVNS